MRVVLVDSSRTVLKAISRLLEARGYDVFSFVDGRDALMQLQIDQAIDAMITSATPLGMSGPELCWEARLLAGTRRPLYLIMMSSNQNERSVVEALDSGADDFISKPPVAEELYARLRVADRVNKMQRELIALATIDALTGVFNRRAFFERANEACSRASVGSNLAAIMLDIDHFKRINDMFGHDVGDVVLRAVAQAAASEAAIVGRLGGEEFAILLEDLSQDELVVVANRLCSKPSALELSGPAGSFKVTCSIGVSAWQPGDTIDRLLKRADVALYEAKAGGRNRVVFARTEDIQREDVQRQDNAA